MKFLDARRLLQEFEGGPPLEFLLGTSGTAEILTMWIEAAGAERGMEARPKTLAFNTLAQELRSAPSGDREVFVLFPWDLVPEADWRSGLPARPAAPEDLERAGREVATSVAERPNAAILYVPAPIPPLGIHAGKAASLGHVLTAAAVGAGATLLPERHFSLESYLRSGFPFSSDHLGELARAIVAAAVRPPQVVGKVAVTDFDNTLWHGVVGEDGIDGVHQGPEGLGFPHFVYQTYLRSLKQAGVLLAGVTRNDPDLATGPIRRGDSPLTEADFVSIIASYNAKSAQIRELADSLNLGLDSFVFIDDNPVEIAEVERALPEVRVIRFPSAPRAMPDFLDQLARCFHREAVTDEDRRRTEMYRARQRSAVPVDAEGADIRDFLESLEMTLTIHDRSNGDRTRAVQLINKTNQFNLNGVRRSDEEVGDILASGGRLLTAALSDRHGDHGEILSYLVDGEGRVRSFVLSCRVFKREVEYAFLCWVAAGVGWPEALEFAPTARNEPFRRFLDDPAATVGEGGWTTVDRAVFLDEHGDALGLFEVAAEG